MSRLLLDRQAASRRIELRNAVTLRIVDPIAEDSRTGIPFGTLHGRRKHRFESGPVKDVVSQDQTYALRPDKPLTDQESLSQAVGRRLFGIFEAHAEIRTVTQQTPE